MLVLPYTLYHRASNTSAGISVMDDTNTSSTQNDLENNDEEIFLWELSDEMVEAAANTATGMAAPTTIHYLPGCC
jgi:hypothetical protein